MTTQRAAASIVALCLVAGGSIAACGSSADIASPPPGGTGTGGSAGKGAGGQGAGGAAGTSAGGHGGSSGAAGSAGHAGAGGAAGAAAGGSAGHAGASGAGGAAGAGGQSPGGAAGHAGGTGTGGSSAGGSSGAGGSGGHAGTTAGGSSGSAGASCGSAICCPGQSRACGTCNLGSQSCESGDWATCAYPPAASTLSLGGTLRDFKSFSAGGHIDFDNATGDDKGIVKMMLGSDMLPVYGYPDDGAGSPTTHGKMFFDQWYRDVPGINQTEKYTLTMQLVAGSEPPQYTFTNNAFFPLDGMLWGNEGYDHNFSFTLELHTQFLYAGGEQFSFTGDDDLYVFINGQLAINLGGVHGAETGVADLDMQASQLGLTTCNQYSFDLFFAERHRTQSEFAAQTTIVLAGKQ